MKEKSNSIIIFLTVVVVCISLFLHSQHGGKGRLKGIISDTAGNPIAGVTVKLHCLRAKSGFETKTDKDGVWKAMWIRGGDWNIDFEKTGYAPKKITTFLKEDSEVVKIETTLNKLKGPALKQELMKDFEKGNRLFNDGKFDEALTIYENILKKFPDSYAISLNLGNCYFEKQEYEKAIQAYKKVLKEDPQNSDAIMSIGNSYSNMKKNEKALEWYKKIDVSKIDDPVVLYNIGGFNFNAGNTKGAIEFFKRSVQVKENFPDGWYQLGMSYMNDGSNKAAIESFESYLKYDKESDKAKQVEEILKMLKQ